MQISLTNQQQILEVKYMNNSNTAGHSNAWIAQTWISFGISLTATLGGIAYLPVDNWVKGYLGMGMLFSVGSTINLSKTTRDIAESRRIISRIDEAKMEKLLAENDPFNK
jgi:hypothetical protein